MSLRHDVPADLRRLAQWLVWRREVRDGKETKVPYQASTPSHRASSTDPSTWGTFEQAVAAVERDKADGIGFAFSPDDPFCGIDLDDQREPDHGWLTIGAKDIVDELDSYTEISPSGTGVHVIVRGRLPGRRNRRGWVELYDRGRYFTITGNRLEGMPHSPMFRQAQLDQLHARLFPPPIGEPPAYSHARRWTSDDDPELVRRMFHAKNGAAIERLWNGDIGGYPSQSEADLALAAHLAFWTGGDAARIESLFRRSALWRPKWERDDYRERTIAKALG